MDLIEAKQRVRDRVGELAPRLVELSHAIHSRPELCYEEHFAHEALTGMLEDEGLEVERGAYGLDTAFEATVGSGPGTRIAIICEYDALPEIGHACGHNIIAAAGLGAGLAAAAVASAMGGRLSILGTPAEEGGGGKELMIRRGAFDGIDAAIMIHPANHELRTMRTIAIHTLTVEYTGRSAHAAAAPENGLNALDAAILGYNNIAALRQHIRSDERIHGVITEGGAKPNIVPEHAAAEWYVRSPTRNSLQPLEERVVSCLRAGADAAGCRMDLEWNDTPYSEMIDNSTLLDRYVANAEAVGRSPAREDPTAMVVGSTDMGNVSHRVPSIHPLVKVSPADVPIHTAAFAEHARSEAGDRAIVDGATVMAMTVTDCWADPAVMEAVQRDFGERPE